MESSSAAVGSSTQKKKPLKKLKANEGKDIISKLPESLISRILSSLPTKDAVRTCVLSKGWICHWTSITKLELRDSAVYSHSPRKKTTGKPHFVNFVNMALLLTKGSSVENFSLVITNKYDASLINTWITSILNRRVKNLCISYNFELPFSALTSHSLFKSHFLEELVLQLSSCAIKIPPNCYVYFRDLKLLKLRGIIFTIDSSVYYQTLCLPVLQKFETKNCTWLGVKGVTIEAFLLESVSIEQDFASVSRKPCSCKIKFYASHLKEFTYRGCGISQSIVLSDPSSARNASANIILYQFENRVPETASCAFLLLKQLSHVKCIKFDGSKVLAQQNMADLPLFAMLNHLELDLVTVDVLLGLLQKSSVLKTLVFKGISKFDQEFLNSAVVPECLTSTLQIVKFEKVNGHEHELYLAKFFMENGMVLERMSFSLVSSGSWLAKSKVMEEFKENLFSFKKGFSFAIVEFSYGYYY